MKKHLSFLLMALFMAIGSFAQTQYNIIVGNGTGTNHFMPAYTYYNYSVSQTIYHQDEINLAGTINSISWSVATNSATRTWKVYLAETELDNFTSSADQLPEASFTEVYNGSVTITAGGLATIELTTPFEYSNEANLVVAVLDMSGSYTSYNNEPYFYVTNHNDGTRTYYSYRDGSAYAVNAGGSASSDTPNIILGIESNDFYCSAPMTIAKTDATTSSITVAWNEVDAPTGYILQYKLASETSWDDAQEVSTSDTTYEIQGLESNTSYSIRVQNACGSSWTSCSARTACEAIATIPWFEDFESYEGNGELEFECWDPIVKPNGPFVYGGYAPPCHSGVNSAEFKGNVNVLVLPEFEEDLGNLRLTFWTTATNTSAGNIRVGYITDLADTNTFVATGNSIAAAARGTSGSGNGNIQGPFDFSGAPQGARIALFYTSTSSNASWNLDDFTVDYIPECAEPTNVTVSNVAAHTADIAWSSEESSFVVSYKASSASDDEWMEESTSDNPYTITGLAPETAYTVKVGVPCGDGSIAYSLERTFTTTIACPAPTGITVSDITTNTATISWTGNGESFYVKAKPATATEWEIEEEAYENTIELQGLASSTIYTVQVIANCGDEDGVSQSASATFQTECDVVSTFPYIEGFESTSLGCWTSEVISGSSNWITSTSYKHSGSRSAYFTYTTNYSARLVSPVFDLSSLTTPKLSYYRYIRPYNGQADSLAVYYRTSPESEWVYLHGAKVADNEFVKIEEILPEPSETYQISFVSLGCDQWGMYIDDFKVEEAPACNPPTQLASSNITTTSVDLTWTGTADSYTIYYKATSATEYETIAGVTLTDEVYTLENLNAATQYTWYVASECEDGSLVPSETTKSFITACDVVSTFPYVADFEGTELVCWVSTPTNGSTNWIVTSSVEGGLSAPTEGTSFAKFKVGTQGSRAELVSPIFDLSSLTAPMLSFQHAQPIWSPDQDTLGLYYRASTADEWTYLASWSNNITSWQNEEMMLPNPSETYQIMFLAHSEWGNGVYVDNLTIDEAPACMAPSVLLSSNTTETTVDLTWSGNVDTYTLYYKETSATEYESIEGVSLTDGIYTLENLTPATQYMWYVASECSDGTTVSSTETKSFRTNCVPFSTIPWFEDFESYVGEGELEFLCWDAVVKPNGPFVYGGHSPSCHSGVNSAEFKGNVNVLVLPEFEEDLHNLRLTFWTTSTSASGSVEVGVMTDPSDTSTFELVGVCEAAASRGSSGSGHGNIQGPFDFNLIQAESGRIALRYTNTSSTASWNLDDFTVDYIPACAEPTNFVANNPAGHSVNLSWSSEESSFVVAYKASTASDDEWETVTDVTENPYTLTGLTPETSYIVKVGVPCSDGSIAYSFVSTFTTTIACPAPTISVSGIATNSATFSWNGDAESYSVNIRPTNATEWEIEETAYENTITITTLNASTNYYVEVIANCGEEDGFSQPGSATFKTACEVVSTFPYTEGFEGTEFGCWTSTPTYGSTNWTVTSNISGTSLSAPTEGTSFAKFQTNSSSGYRAELVSPIFDLSSLNAPMLSFQHAQPKWGSDQDTLGLYYRASASDEWTYLASWTNDMTSWQAEEFLLPNSSESYQIMFLAYSHYGYGVYVDNLTIDEAPTCAAPSSLSSANVTETTIDLSWEGVVDNYTVYYKTNAETEYTSVAATLTDGVFTLTGLNPSSTYTWYVASVCEDGTETPSLSTSTFMTACGVVAAFPYFESFEASTLGCWNYEQIAGVDHWFIGDEFTVSGSQCAQHSYEPGASSRLVSPIFDLTSLTNPTLTYQYYIKDYNGTADSLALYYRTSADDEWVYLNGFREGTNGYVLDSLTLPNPTSTYQISFIAIGYDGWYIFLDDVQIFDAEGGDTPVVVPPTVSTLAATEVTMTSATLNGTVVAGTETITAQGFEYKEATAATFTTVSAEATSFTATINNLTANTSYVYKSFATTASGTVYGSEMTFTTLADTTSGGGEEPCQPTTSAITETICQGESFDFNGTSYTTAGTYTATLVNAAGCDSVITLTLVVNPVTTSAPELVSICSGETYEWNGVTYNAAGTYTDTLTNAAGCDSIITLTLTVNVAEDTYDTVTVNAGETYEWNGETYTAEEGTYTAELADENGCAYTATLVVIVTEGLNDAENMINITLYPNPTTSNATLTVEGLNEEATIMLTDVQGRTIANTKLAQGQTTTTIETSDLTSGVYYIRLITSTTTRTEKLIKK